MKQFVSQIKQKKRKKEQKKSWKKAKKEELKPKPMEKIELSREGQNKSTNYLIKNRGPQVESKRSNSRRTNQPPPTAVPVPVPAPVPVSVPQ